MLRRQGIEIDASLEIPECPGEFAHILGWYDELRGWGRQAFQGVHSIVWADAHAWRVEMQVTPRPTATEWRLLMRLDQMFRDAAEKNRPKQKTPNKAPGR